MHTGMEMGRSPDGQGSRTAPQSGFVEGGGVRLHYVDWGGDKPALLLVHATGFHARLWDPFAQRLRARFRVIAIDQRGHGDSSAPAGGITWGDLAEDVHAVIGALGIESCDAAGHSSGGTAIAVSAARYPGSIRRLVLIDPVLGGDGDGRQGASNPMAERTRRRRHVWESPHQLEEAMRSRGAFARWRPEFLHLYAQHGVRRREDGHYELKCSPEREAQVYERSAAFNPWPELSRLQTPSLLLRAAGVDPSGGFLSPETSARIPHCTEVAIRATHFIPMEEPEQVIAAFEEFFSRG
jgi:pimeloyl-ACP methyl ester carboxylesterase